MKSIKMTWNNLFILFKDCNKCVLSKNRNQVVFGKGPKDARVLLIGQAPGKDEDREGKPFVGKMGKLNYKIWYEERIDLNKCYITNTCACYPPKDRMPKTEEVKACFDRLTEEIELVNPEWIIYIGMRAGTIQQLGAYYAKFFSDYKTHFVNHPGSIRHDSSKLEQIRSQIRELKKIMKEEF